MDIEAPALGWVTENLGQARQDVRSGTGISEPAAIRTSYYETQVKVAESPDPPTRGLALQLTLADNRQFFVALGGTQLAPQDVTVTAPGDFLQLQLHVNPETCSLHPALYRSGSLIFKEAGARFDGTINGTCDGGSRVLRIAGTAARQPDSHLEDLLTLQDGGDAAGHSSVRRKVLERFAERLKASPGVRPVFFPRVQSTVRVPDDAWVNSISVALICAAVGELSIRNFRQLVDTRAITQYLDAQFESAAARTCARALYDEAHDEFAVSSGGRLFSEYLLRREHWSSVLSSWVKGGTFLAAIGGRFSAGDVVDANRTLNRALYLLKRLGAPIQEIEAVRKTFSAFPLWTEASPGMDLDRMDFPNSTFSGAVIAAASEERSNISPGSRDGSYNVYYGENLVNFLNTQARSFRTPVRADDHEWKGPCSVLFCFITGTPIQLADGRQIPIESVPPGECVLAADGSTTVHSSEEIVFPGAPHEALYGINDIPPFFTGGHMILTTQGYRAIDPDAPRRENPDVEVGRLQVGDKVIRLASVDPFRAEEMEVKSISSRMLSAESRVYGLKLEGSQSYFANGIAVSANYPRLTEERIAEGIRSLSESDRAVLLETLSPVMPLLVEAMRDFAGPRLYEALGINVEESTDDSRTAAGTRR